MGPTAAKLAPWSPPMVLNFIFTQQNKHQSDYWDSSGHEILYHCLSQWAPRETRRMKDGPHLDRKLGQIKQCNAQIGISKKLFHVTSSRSLCDIFIPRKFSTTLCPLNSSSRSLVSTNLEEPMSLIRWC